MSRFLIEHLPQAPAAYTVAPLSFQDWQTWVQHSLFVSLIRTTEMISAIESTAGITLHQADHYMSLRPGDEAVLVTLSFGVLLAFAEGQIPPLPEDWRCLLLTVASPAEPVPELMTEALVLEDEFPDATLN
jgi:hypothetical protein